MTTKIDGCWGADFAIGALNWGNQCPWVAELFNSEPGHFKSITLIQFWSIVSPEYFKFLCAVFLHYDYIEVIEFALAKLILYSLKLTHTPKLSLSRVMSYFCSLYLVITIVVYTLFIFKLVCRQLQQSPFSSVVTTCYAILKLQILTREFESHVKQTLLAGVKLNIIFYMK